MRALGIVQWANRDKGSMPIAGVRPLLEIQGHEWRLIDAAEEFPSQGQVFWPNALSAVEGALVIIRAERQIGQKDEYKVGDARPAMEVLDLRDYGTPADVRRALDEGVRWPGPAPAGRFLVWCQPGVLVGPVDLARSPTGTIKLGGANLARVALYASSSPKLISADRQDRFVRTDDTPPAGYVDWDADGVVLRRALEAAVRIAKQAGGDTGQTKKQIDDAVRSLVAQGLGADAQLDKYRLERAALLCAHTDDIARLAPELIGVLSAHPTIVSSLNQVEVEVRARVEASARADLEQKLTKERAALAELAAAREQIVTRLAASERQLSEVEGELQTRRAQADAEAVEVEGAFAERIREVLQRPASLLAEASVLRPLLGLTAVAVPARVDRNGYQSATSLEWANRRVDRIGERGAMKRALTNAARARGVDPSAMFLIHAAIVAQLMPIALGPGSLAALAGYAHVACGSRLSLLHMSAGFAQPRDIADAVGDELASHPRTGTPTSIGAGGIDRFSLLVLEGANRAPLEASVVPLLQLAEAGLSHPTPSARVRLAATLVSGATTVPVSPQIWSHAVAISPERLPGLSASQTQPTEMAIDGELLSLGDVPTTVVEDLLGACPECREIQPALERFGAALARLYEEQQIKEALLEGAILPFVLTTFGGEELDEVLRALVAEDEALLASAKRLRRRLC